MALQTYSNLTTEAGLSELAGYASGMGPDKQAYILNISSCKLNPISRIICFVSLLRQGH